MHSKIFKYSAVTSIPSYQCYLVSLEGIGYIDSYINAFLVSQQHLNIETAVLGCMFEINKFVSSKLGKKNYGALLNERFVPYVPSKNVFIKSQQIADDLGIDNPMRDVIGTLANIRLQLFNVGLEDEFPDIENPLKINVIPDLVGQVNETITSTAPVASAPANTGFIGQGNINIDPVTRLTMSEDVLLDPLEKRYVKNKRTNTRLT